MKKLLFFLIVSLLTCSAQAKYKVGSIYNKDGVKGFVVAVDDTGEHGLMMSLKESKADWTDSKDVLLSTTAFYEDDGEKNMQAIERYIEENGEDWSLFPVFEWARSLGEGWYIPSKEEALLIWKNLNGGDLKFNKAGAKSWKDMNKRIKKAKGDSFISGNVVRSMITSTEAEGGKIWGITLTGRFIAAKGVHNSPIEAIVIKKNDHTISKDIKGGRSFRTRAVKKF